jgi:hypothetical protein
MLLRNATKLRGLVALSSRGASRRLLPPPFSCSSVVAVYFIFSFVLHCFPSSVQSRCSEQLLSCFISCATLLIFFSFLSSAK